MSPIERERRAYGDWPDWLRELETEREDCRERIREIDTEFRAYIIGEMTDNPKDKETLAAAGF